MEMSEIVVVYVTAPEAVAPDLARALVERRVCACVNILPKIRSIYRWQGSVQDDAEALMIIKTTKARWAALASAVATLHPYDVPEIIALPVSAAHPPYAAWVHESVDAS